MKKTKITFLTTLIFTSLFSNLYGQDDCFRTEKLNGMPIELCLNKRWNVFLDGWFVHIHIDKKYFVRIDMFPDSIPTDLQSLSDYRLFPERNENEKYTSYRPEHSLGDSAVLIKESIIHRRKNNKIKKVEVVYSLYCSFDGKIYSIFFKKNDEFDENDVMKMFIFHET